MLANSLKADGKAVQQLIGDNYEEIIDLIFLSKWKEKRISCLKMVINLVMEASHELSTNAGLFKRIFDICKDPQVDKVMLENILWMATQLLDDYGDSSKNFDSLLLVMRDNEICQIILTAFKTD